MYAVVRRNCIDDDKWAAADAQRTEFDRIHAEQSGFITSFTVDAGEGELLIMNLWETAEDAQRAGGSPAPQLLGVGIQDAEDPFMLVYAVAFQARALLDHAAVHQLSQCPLGGDLVEPEVALQKWRVDHRMRHQMRQHLPRRGLAPKPLHSPRGGLKFGTEVVHKQGSR